MHARGLPSGTVHVISGASAHHIGLTSAIFALGLPVIRHDCIDDFVLFETTDEAGCIVLEVSLAYRDRANLVDVLSDFEGDMPVVVVADCDDVPTSVQAMKAGATDYLVHPVSSERLMWALTRAVCIDQRRRRRDAARRMLLDRYVDLAGDEKWILRAVVDGKMNKQIARELFCSERTVKARRSQVMQKFGARSIVELVRIWKQLEPGLGCIDRSSKCSAAYAQGIRRAAHPVEGSI